MRDIGAKALARALRSWTALREIDLEVCEIGDDGAAELFSAIEVSPTLRSVSVKTNMIRDGSPLERCVEHNYKIIGLNIEYNDMDFKSFTVIQKLVASNLRRWTGEHKTCTPEETMEMEARNQQLEEIRQAVIDERKLISTMMARRDEASEELAHAEEARGRRIGGLETQVDALNADGVRQTDEWRASNEEARKTKAIHENELSQLSRCLTTEMDQGAVWNKHLETLEAQIERCRRENAKSLQELSQQLLAAKRRYWDVKAMIVSMWEQQKMEAEEALRRKAEEAQLQAKQTSTPTPKPTPRRVKQAAGGQEEQEKAAPDATESSPISQNGSIRDTAEKPLEAAQNGPEPAVLPVESSRSFATMEGQSGE
jgi:hypothetical protein